MSNFYNKNELERIGFKKIGKNVLISRKASIYSAETIEIGDNVRIDDFCILSGNIIIGNNIHISAYCGLYGGGLIKLSDYSGCSQRCTLISSSDDFSGDYMIGAVLPDKYKNVTKGEILLEKYVQLGANTTVLPNVTVKEGAITGAMTLVNRDLEQWSIYIGIPAHKLKDRAKKMLDLVEEYEKNKY